MELPSAATLLLVLLVSPAIGQNLVVNGDAEAGVGSSSGYDILSAPGWTQTGSFTVVQYGAPGFPNAGSAGPPNRGANFFAGGPGFPQSDASQLVDVASLAAEIDAGRVDYLLAGYLGGYDTQNDNAVVVATFLDAGGVTLGSGQIGPVLAAERGNVSGLLARSSTGAVAPGTRTIEVLISCSRVSGSYNDGYADDVELSLTVGAGPTISVTPIAGGSPATLSIQNATPNGGVLFAYSLTGAGPTPTPFGPALLSPPIWTLPQISADPNGSGSLTQNVPPAASGRPVWLQAADLGSGTLSNGLAEVIG